MVLVGYSEEEDEEDSRKEKRFDRTMHRVARNADCDLVVAKFRREEMKTVLVPLGAEPQLRVTGLLCKALASVEGTSFRFLRVIPPGSSTGEARWGTEKILQAGGLAGMGELQVVESESLLDTLQAQASDRDLVIVGPAVTHSAFGAILTKTGEKIAERVSSSVLLTRAR